MFALLKSLPMVLGIIQWFQRRSERAGHIKVGKLQAKAKRLENNLEARREAAKNRSDVGKLCDDELDELRRKIAASQR